MAVDESEWSEWRKMLQERLEQYEASEKKLAKGYVIRLKDNIKAWDENRHNESKLSGFDRGILGGINHDCTCGKHWVEYGEPDDIKVCPEQRPI